MISPRIAIATADGVSVCDHLARSTSFLVLHIEDGRVTSRDTRTRYPEHCGNHMSFVELLDGCQAVICGGIGQGAVDSLIAHGIQPLVLAQPGPIEQAIDSYLAGKLVTTDIRVCLCH